MWEGIEFPNELVEKELKIQIAMRLTPQPLKVRSDIEVTCFAYEGIDAIKEALRQAELDNDDEEDQVKMKLISTPLYVSLTWD